MSWYHPLPTDDRIYEPMVAVDAACPGCGSANVKRYKALRSWGWHIVERCRDCFTYLSSEPTNQSYVPLTAGWPVSSAG